MELSKETLLIEKLLDAIEKRLPEYLANPEDLRIANGNVAVCVIDAEGRIYGRIFGKNKIKQREVFGVAWKKASQVWITGIATNKYEKMVYAGEIDPDQFGIMHPEFIGWEGGQPVALGEIKLAVGFSGMRGVNDLEIVTKAAEEVGGI
jgi:glc operon protein GlcG